MELVRFAMYCSVSLKEISFKSQNRLANLNVCEQTIYINIICMRKCYTRYTYLIVYEI